LGRVHAAVDLAGLRGRLVTERLLRGGLAGLDDRAVLGDVGDRALGGGRLGDFRLGDLRWSGGSLRGGEGRVGVGKESGKGADDTSRHGASFLKPAQTGRKPDPSRQIWAEPAAGAVGSAVRVARPGAEDGGGKSPVAPGEFF